MNRSYLALFFVVLGTGCGAHATSGGKELKVTRAVLYQNGIGYFERRGEVDGDTLRIRVRPEQIRDVLKSLTVVDFSDGHAVSVGLPIEKSRAQQLSDLPEQVRNEGGLLAIAGAFRGARCSVSGERSVTGRLVGVENVGSSGGEAAKPDWRITVLTDGGELAQLRVDKIKALKVLDGTLEVGLRKALDATLDAGSWKPVDVTVRLSGKSTHNLAVSYVVAMPAWKPAYRIVMQKDQKALLQGWAVVDNVSGDDWNGVKLSLTAGTPLAFTYDLYTPRMPQRPHLQARDEIAQIPTAAFETAGGIAAPAMEEEMAASMDADKSAERDDSSDEYARRPSKAKKSAPSASTRGGGRTSMPKGMAPPPPPSAAPATPMSREALERNFRSLVAGASVGSLFRYDLAEPVTIPERQSALVNIVNAKIPGEDCLLFRVGQDSVTPYRAVRVANDSGFVLESGPVAIYRADEADGTFLGEALAQRIEKNSNTFVPYALDGRIRLTLDQQNTEEGVTLVKIANGVLTTENKQVTRYIYDVDNGSGEATTLYVRRDRKTGWKLTSKEKVIEEGGAYYLPMKLAATGRTRVTVEEETPTRRTVEIWSDWARQAIGLYLSSTSADPKVTAQLKEALTLRERSGQLDREIQTLEEQRQTQSAREAEVRENIKALGKTSKNGDLKKKLENSLAQLEDGLNTTTRKIVQLSMERGEVQTRLGIVIKGISLDTGK